MPASLELTTDELLTTTRAVRKRLDFDRSVELDLLKECLSIGLQAPSGSNAQNWHFAVVQDAHRVEQIGRLYQEVWPGTASSRSRRTRWPPRRPNLRNAS